MGAVIAVTNQKGGVAKTTTVHSLASALAEMGRKVQLVDLDPQACLTYSTGVDPEGLQISIHDVMLGRVKADEIRLDLGGIDLLPATIDLAGTEIHLLTKTGREFVLQRALKPFVGDYDYTFIDCGPSLGILTINALTAATHALIPFQAETLSHRAIRQLRETMDDVRHYTNEELLLLGAVATMFDQRTRLSQRVLEEVSEMYGLDVLPPPIPRSVRVAEAPEKGRSVLEHAGSSKPAQAYRELATSLEAAV